MEATALLKKDHAKVKELFKKFEGTGERAEQAKQRLFNEIKSQLDAHAAVEEELFYPAMQTVRSKEVQEMVLEAIEEHKVVKTLLQEIAELTPANDEFDAKMKVLMENVEHHADEEEEEMFPQAEEHLSDQRRAEIGEQMQSRKDSLKAA